MRRAWGPLRCLRRPRVLVAACVALGLCPSGAAHAGTGQAISAPFDLDTRNPSVAEVQPADGATDQSRVLDVVVRFDSGVDPASLSTATVQITGSTSGAVGRTLTYQPEALLLTAHPAQPFALGERVTVAVSAGIRDAFGNPLTPARTWAFTVGQHTPELTVDRVTVDASGKVRITYTSADPDGSYMATAGWQFSLDGATWQDIGAAQIQANDLQTPGTRELVWVATQGTHSLAGLEAPTVWVRMQATDSTYSSGYAASPPFSADLNEPPAAREVTGPSGEIAGDARIGYQLSDPERDALTLRPEYSSDAGRTWHRATVAGDTIGITAYTGTLTWRTGANLAGFDGQAVLRITPWDRDAGTPALSSALHIDNNQPPSATVQDIYRPVADTVRIQYTLADAEHDTLRIRCAFSIDGGATWEPATVRGDTTGVSSYVGSILWLAGNDERVISTTMARFRVSPLDNDVGSAGQTANFQWVYHETIPPSLVAVEAVMGQVEAECARRNPRHRRHAQATGESEVGGSLRVCRLLHGVVLAAGGDEAGEPVGSV